MRVKDITPAEYTVLRRGPLDAARAQHLPNRLDAGSWGDMMKLVAAVLCLLAVAVPRASEAQNLVVTNARIVDGKGGVIERGSVVVRDGKIVSVAAGAAASVAGAQRIDAQGRTLMPGLHRRASPHRPGQRRGVAEDTRGRRSSRSSSTPVSPPCCARSARRRRSRRGSASRRARCRGRGC